MQLISNQSNRRPMVLPPVVFSALSKALYNSYFIRKNVFLTWFRAAYLKLQS
jgi:hypothetical protein